MIGYSLRLSTGGPVAVWPGQLGSCMWTGDGTALARGGGPWGWVQPWAHSGRALAGLSLGQAAKRGEWRQL